MENKDKVFGYCLNELKHGDKGVLKFEGKWSECAVSIEKDEEGTTWVHICIDEEYLDGREAKEKFGYGFSWAIAEIDSYGVTLIYEEDIEDITNFFLLEGEKAEPSEKKHWVFKADGLSINIHDSKTDEKICSAIHSDGILAEAVDIILKKYGYYTYNFKFNEKGQIC